jgi:glycosyltransferase involved in cell wall biosynthesis
MARIAFYAPLKPPDHEVPSGDRRVAGLFLDALRLAGYDPFIVSRLRGFDGIGDEGRQRQIAARGREIAGELIAQWRKRPEARSAIWLTYHLYYKAPDWIGPTVCEALDMRYVVAEASVAMKRAEGKWALGHRAVVEALRRADLVIGLNPADREGVEPLVNPTAYQTLPPFLDTRGYAAAPYQPLGPPRLVTVAMMRPGDKLASYRVLGGALAQLLDLEWTLEVIGDGPARGDVEAALAPLGDRVRYAGALDEKAVAARLAGNDLFVWPAINEAFGMAILEAQASSLAVVAGDSGGVGAVVAGGKTGLLVPPGGIAAFAAAVRQMIEDPARRAALGKAARRNAVKRHDLAAAAEKLRGMIAAVRPNRAA